MVIFILEKWEKNEGLKCAIDGQTNGQIKTWVQHALNIYLTMLFAQWHTYFWVWKLSKRKCDREIQHQRTWLHHLHHANVIVWKFGCAHLLTYHFELKSSLIKKNSPIPTIQCSFLGLSSCKKGSKTHF